MPIVYKIDIIQALKKAGYSTYKIRQDNLLSQSTITKLNQGNTKITIDNLLTLCSLLNCQPGDILEYVPDKE